MYGTSWFHLFFHQQNVLRQPNKLYDINEFSAIKFRGFSTRFVVFRELICLFTKYKKWEKHIYDIV